MLPTKLLGLDIQRLKSRDERSAEPNSYRVVMSRRVTNHHAHDLLMSSIYSSKNMCGRAYNREKSSLLSLKSHSIKKQIAHLCGSI